MAGPLSVEVEAEVDAEVDAEVVIVQGLRLRKEFLPKKETDVGGNLTSAILSIP